MQPGGLFAKPAVFRGKNGHVGLKWEMSGVAEELDGVVEPVSF